MRRTWIVQVNQSILGPVVPQARPEGGTFVPAAQLPAPLRQYLMLPLNRNVRPVLDDFKNMAEVDALEIDEHLLRRTVTARGYARLLTVRLPDAYMPVPPRKRQTVPRNIPAVRSLRQLCRFFNADTPRSLNRRVYKDTDCGASISLLLKDGSWLHNGAEGWKTLDIKTPILGFTIQTIVEGSGAEVNSDTFYLPVRHSEIDAWMKNMEADADRLWHDANTDTEEDTQ